MSQGNTKIFYFAYGSNLLIDKLRLKVPSAEPIHRGFVLDYDLDFVGTSQDNSGRLTLIPAQGKKVPGVIYTINSAERSLLDVDQGQKGYTPFDVIVKSNGHDYKAFAYLIDQKSQPSRPYSWYLDQVIAGAGEQGLGREHLKFLNEQPFVADKNIARLRSNTALLQPVRLSATERTVIVQFKSKVTLSDPLGDVQTYLGRDRIGGKQADFTFKVACEFQDWITYIIQAPTGSTFSIDFTFVSTAAGVSCKTSEKNPIKGKITQDNEPTPQPQIALNVTC